MEDQRQTVKTKYFVELSKTDVSSEFESEETETDEGSSSWWWGSKTSEKTTQARKSPSGDCSDSSDSDEGSKTLTNDSKSWWCSVV